MKIKIVISLVIGMLFFINAFDQLWWVFYSVENLEAIRKGGWFSYYNPVLDEISRWLFLISALGFIGLILASIIGLKTCKKLQISRHNVSASFLIAYIINKPLMTGFMFFGFRSWAFQNVSVYVFFPANFFLSILTGTVFLILPLYFKYFKLTNPGGKA